MNIARIRQETQEDHLRVEGAMPVMGPDLDRASYVAVLRRLFGLVEAWEQAVERDLPEALGPIAKQRSRLDLLRQDLADFGESASDLTKPKLPAFPNLFELLGAMYVMEGSRLGGQFIAKHVESVLGLEGGQGVRYFRGFGNATKARWTELIATLEAEIPEQDADQAIRGAKKMFAAFGEWMSGLERPTAVYASASSLT